MTEPSIIPGANKVGIRPGMQSYLVLNNVAKDTNFGYLIRTANAFGAVPVIVGRRRFHKMGACAGTSHTPILSFYSLEKAIQDLRQRNCTIFGIEILPDATPITRMDFDSPVAFLIGNEGEGLIAAQKQYCDQFVYIPQFGNAVSLNINVATGIVLHQYATQAGFQETARRGEKFLSEPQIPRS